MNTLPDLNFPVKHVSMQQIIPCRAAMKLAGCRRAMHVLTALSITELTARTLEAYNLMHY